jgi:hypothetical protein
VANINIDGKEYDLEQLSEEARGQVVSLQFVDAELLRLNAQIAVHQTAKNAYLNALKLHLAIIDGNAPKLQ